ncbi:MAG: hypothetical protein H0T49_04010 [Chloroflexia bacterium]|nr:hypothetical protein [Chloroflexia bacterium]
MTGAAPPPKEFHHYGLRALERPEAADFVPLTRVWVTDPRHHPQRIEYLCYEPDSFLAEEFKNAPHVAYKVAELGPHIAGKDIVLLFEVGDPPFAKVAFTREDGIVYEYLEFKPGRTWFTEES